MKKQAPRLVSVQTGSEKTVTVTYNDGRTAQVDMTGVIDALDIFAPLDDPAEFVRVEITDFGWTLEWDCGASLDSDRILEMALEQSGLEDNVKFRHWQDRNGLSLTEAAKAIGITRRTVSQYRTGTRPVPRTVSLACKGWEAERHPHS